MGGRGTHQIPYENDGWSSNSFQSALVHYQIQTLQNHMGLSENS